MSDSLQPHGLQHSRLHCPSPTPGVCWNSWPLSWWCHSTVSFSVVPFSFCLQSFPASGFFPEESALCIRWPKYWSYCFSSSPSSEYSGLISFWIDSFVSSPWSPRDSQESSTAPWFEASIVWHSAFFMVQLSHPYMPTGKAIALTISQTFWYEHWGPVKWAFLFFPQR